jgi:hypothetical protein
MRHRVDQRRLFDLGNEAFRQHKAAFGVLPAHQGFRADHPSGGDLRFRLVPYPELAVQYRVGERAQQDQVVAARPILCGVV